MESLPIVCTLSAADQAARAAAARTIASEWMLGAQITDRGASMRFRAEAESDLRELIAAESKCCEFLDFELRAETPGLRLTVEGPEGARPIILELFGLEPAAG
jgi:hypothetical protein